MEPPLAKEDLALPPLLADLRKHAGMRQRDLGRKVGVHEDTIGRYEQRAKRVSPDILANLIVALKLDNDVAALVRQAWEYDEPYWLRRGRAATSSTPADTTISTTTTPVAPTITATHSEPDVILSPELPGAKELEALLPLMTSKPLDEEFVRKRLRDVRLLAVGELDELGLMKLVHCTDGPVPAVPVFTSMEHLRRALQFNESWRGLDVFEVDGRMMLSYAYGALVSINPWSGHEFRLKAIDTVAELF